MGNTRAFCSKVLPIGLTVAHWSHCCPLVSLLPIGHCCPLVTVAHWSHSLYDLVRPIWNVTIVSYYKIWPFMIIAETVRDIWWKSKANIVKFSRNRGFKIWPVITGILVPKKPGREHVRTLWVSYTFEISGIGWAISDNIRCNCHYLLHCAEKKTPVRAMASRHCFQFIFLCQAPEQQYQHSIRPSFPKFCLWPTIFLSFNFRWNFLFRYLAFFRLKQNYKRKALDNLLVSDLLVLLLWSRLKPDTKNIL
jgi:hypothetical protein